jgi:hypothetical protein
MLIVFITTLTSFVLCWLFIRPLKSPVRAIYSIAIISFVFTMGLALAWNLSTGSVMVLLGLFASLGVFLLFWIRAKGQGKEHTDIR